MMFSYFEGGIFDTKCKKIVGLPELRQMIRNNPNAEKITRIRDLRKKGDEYKSVKEELPYITPNCILDVRSLKGENLEKNFRQFSQYMYFDFDGQGNPEEYKRCFIERYGQLASLICLSTSAGGVSVLFKIKNTITLANFDNIWTAVRNTILSTETVDPSCQGVGRAMFISHDPEVYCNFDNEIELDISAPIQDQVEKTVNQCKTYSQFNFRLNSPFSILDIDIVLGKIRTRTTLENPSPVVDFKPLEYTEVYFQKNIPDGSKHRTYTSMIHTLVHLNPGIERQYIFSYLYFINEQHARPKMDKRELRRLFDAVFDGINNSGLSYVNKEIKYVHFNPDCRLSKAERIEIANTLNGARRKNQTIQKIISAKQKLENQGKKVTQKRIAEIAKLSPKTVRSHLNSELIDIDELVQMINDSVPIKNTTASMNNTCQISQ